MLFISLNDLSALDLPKGRALCGGKAANLARMGKAGFRIPRAFVVTTNAFSDVMLKALQKTEGTSFDPRKLIAEMTLDTSFESSFFEHCKTLGAPLFAIRSSATDEDAADHSFAGLLESVINVPQTECLQAVRRVWQSFYARERLMFPSQTAPDADIPSMAVIVQECIKSDVAGVLFTKHPLDGEGSVLLNVAQGEGETVVSGKGGIALSIKKDDNPDAYPKCDILSQQQLHELVEIAKKIETTFGKPQDIEFAFSDGKLYLLQMRDIAANHAGANVENHLFSNVNVGEALSGVCTPMTWSVGMDYAEHGFQTVFHAAGLNIPKGYNFVTTFFGHIYLDISQILSVATQVPFITRDMFGKIAGIPHISDYVCDVERMSRSKFLSQFPISVFRVLKTQSRVKKLNEHAELFCKWRDQFMTRDFSDHAMLAAAFDDLHSHFIECGDDMLAAGMSFMASYFLVSLCIDRVSDKDAAELDTYMFSGILDVKSAAPGLELKKMATGIANYNELKDYLLKMDFSQKLNNEQLFNQIKPFPGAEQFISQFKHFLVEYGARANQEAELANPRWREDSRFLYQVIQNHLRSKDQIFSNNNKQNSANEMEQFENSLFGPNRLLFKKLLNYARSCARTREMWRAYVVDALGAFRHFFLSCARLMIKQNILSQPDDIFYLSLSEVREWINDCNALPDALLRVAFRRARHDAFLSAQCLPNTFTRHPNICPNVDPCKCQKQLRGLPASPGNVKAKVRVIRDLQKDAASLQYGEIIVAASTDVGWTPLFLLASAILTEQGGPLSHASVVAREYHVPAIVSIPGLLNTLHTGDTVYVSASRGIVTIEK